MVNIWSQLVLAKSAQKLLFATMRKKCKPIAEKRDFLLKNVTFCHAKSTGEFSAFLDQMRQSDATKSHLVKIGTNDQLRKLTICTCLRANRILSKSDGLRPVYTVGYPMVLSLSHRKSVGLLVSMADFLLDLMSVCYHVYFHSHMPTVNVLVIRVVWHNLKELLDFAASSLRQH
jgi:hypothetical protein